MLLTLAWQPPLLCALQCTPLTPVSTPACHVTNLTPSS